METVILVLDESGAKGYSDKRESAPGELGVMAGFLVLERDLVCFANALSPVRDRYLNNGKVHIADLAPADQEQLRSEIFSFFKSYKVPWLYEAAYVEGLHAHAEHIKDLLTQAKQNRVSKIKVSGNERKELLHSELFCGAFGKGIAFAMDLVGSEFHINVITDRVDKKLLEMFKAEANSFLHVEEPQSHVVTGFDPESKQIVKRAVLIRNTDGQEVLGDFSKVSYSIKCADSSLTLAADVLANSVYHHLETRQEQSIGESLNTIEAIQGHELAELVYGAHDSSQSNSFPDGVYRYPEMSSKRDENDT